MFGIKETKKIDPSRAVRAVVTSVIFERKVPGGNGEEGSTLLVVRVSKEDCKDMPTFAFGDVVEVVNTGTSTLSKKKGSPK